MADRCCTPCQLDPPIHSCCSLRVPDDEGGWRPCGCTASAVCAARREEQVAGVSRG